MNIYIESIDNINIKDINLSLFKEEKLNHLKKIKNINHQKQSILGEYLLITHLPEYNLNYKDITIKYNPNNKPYIVGNPVYYNISHSGKYVVLAISKYPLGIDIQKIKPKPNFNSYLSKQFNIPSNSYFTTKMFTLIEAELKLEGSSIIHFNNTKLNFQYKFTSITYDNYIITICYSKE